MVTNKCCVAEQIKCDKVENVATGEVKRRECGKLGKSQNFEQHRDGWGQKWKNGKARKSENSGTDEERKDQDEEKLCTSTIESLERRNRAKHVIKQKLEKGNQRVLCVNDVAGTELPWHDARQAPEQEYLRDFGVYEKLMKVEQLHSTRSLKSTHSGLTRTRNSRVSSCRSGHVAREFESEDRQYLYAGTPPMEALRAIISVAANHKQTFSIMHIDVSRVYFRARAQGNLCWSVCQWRAESAPTLGKVVC